jgi:hypothetical protein
VPVPVPQGLVGVAELATPPVPGRAARGSKAVAFHSPDNPQALSNMQEQNLSCARD